MKVFRPDPVIIKTCYQCPFAHMHKQGFFKPAFRLFCTVATYPMEIANKGKFPILKDLHNDKNTYVWLDNPNVIPEWCPLEEYSLGVKK